MQWGTRRNQLSVIARFNTIIEQSRISQQTVQGLNQMPSFWICMSVTFKVLKVCALYLNNSTTLYVCIIAPSDKKHWNKRMNDGIIAWLSMRSHIGMLSTFLFSTNIDHLCSTLWYHHPVSCFRMFSLLHFYINYLFVHVIVSRHIAVCRVAQEASASHPWVYWQEE